MSSSNQQPTFETSFTNDVKWNTTTTSATANANANTTTTSNDDHSKQNSQNQHQNQYQSNKNINNFDPLSSSSSVGQIDDGHLANNSSNAINSTSASASTNNQDQTSPEDLSLFISDLLEQMQTKFENMGTTIVNRIDDMGSRIDTLEKSIGDLMEQSGLSEPTYGSAGNSIKQSTDHSDE